MRKLLIFDPKQSISDQRKLALDNNISEITDSIPTRYSSLDLIPPCIIIESANQPEKVLLSINITDINIFSFDFDSIEELPIISRPLSTIERINAIWNEINKLTTRLDTLER